MLVYFGCFMFFDKPFNLITTPTFVKDEKGVSGPSSQMVLDTIVFETFVLMCLFNQINCRVITPEDNINIFQSLCNNFYFWLIFIFEFGMQFMFVNLASERGEFLGMTSLTLNQKIVCYSLAAGTLLVNILARKVVPLKPFEKLAEKLKLDDDKEKGATQSVKDKMVNWKTKAFSKVVDARMKKKYENRESLLPQNTASEATPTVIQK